MIPTEYLRQVPIKHWLPIPVAANERTERVAAGSGTFSPMRLKEEITGYKFQRAWAKSASWEADDEYHAQRNLLAQGEDVEGFQWLDEPIKG